MRGNAIALLDSVRMMKGITSRNSHVEYDTHTLCPFCEKYIGRDVKDAGLEGWECCDDAMVEVDRIILGM